MWSSNPVFGLNALGGAVNIQMKNGFIWQGFEAQAMGGSYGRMNGSVQYGAQKGDYAVYLAAEGLRDQIVLRTEHIGRRLGFDQRVAVVRQRIANCVAAALAAHRNAVSGKIPLI